jgi:hypothetical protein
MQGEICCDQVLVRSGNSSSCPLMCLVFADQGPVCAWAQNVVDDGFLGAVVAGVPASCRD